MKQHWNGAVALIITILLGLVIGLSVAIASGVSNLSWLGIALFLSGFITGGILGAIFMLLFTGGIREPRP